MDQRKKIVIPNFGNETLLPRTSNDWTRTRERDGFMSEVLGILNRITPENLLVLSHKLVEVVHSQPSRSKELVVAIAKKAYTESKFSETYAKLCVAIEPEVPWFRTMVVGYLQHDANSILDECAKSVESAESVDRHRAFGVFTFLGELFNVKIYPLDKVHEYVNTLFAAKSRAAIEIQLECVCKLLATVGEKFDVGASKRRVNVYFQRVDKNKDKIKLCSRVKFALRGLVELRENAWKPRKADSKPKLIKDIHEEARY